MNAEFLTGFSDVLQDQEVPDEALACNTIVAHDVFSCARTLSQPLGSMKACSESGVLLNEHPKQMIVDK